MDRLFASRKASCCLLFDWLRSSQTTSKIHIHVCQNVARWTVDFFNDGLRSEKFNIIIKTEYISVVRLVELSLKS